LNALEAAARLANNAQDDRFHFNSPSLSKLRPQDAGHSAASSPAVVLDLVRRLKALAVSSQPT
jgi:hypothetical protein